MASQPSHRRDERGTLSLVVRLVTALALGLLSLPAFNTGAFADDTVSDRAADTGVVSDPAPEEGPREPDAEDLPPAEEPPPAEESVVEEPVVEDPAPADVSDEESTTKTPDALSVAALAPLAIDVCDQGFGQVDFLQYTNYDVNGTGDWANGNMNDQKANLVEGEFVWQRVVMSGLKAGPQKLVLTYDVTNAGKYAYDFLDRFELTAGDTLLVDYTNKTGPVATATITWDMPAAGGTTLQFGAHVASELDWGAGTGAGSISGSPYHVSLQMLNCASTGQKDNQIMASAIDAGDITVTKDAIPNSLEDFSFSITPGGLASNFLLDDDAGLPNATSTLPNTKTFSAGPGQYTITENGANTGGWSLTDISCSSSPIGNSNADTTGAGVVSKTATSVTVNIIDDVETACTFTNSRTATIQVDKMWDVNGTEYENGDQPEVIEGTASLTLGGASKTFGTTYNGYLAGSTVSINESSSVDNELCTVTARRITDANGDEVAPVDGALPYSATLQGGANTYTLTNYVTCRSTLQLNKVVDNGPAAASAWTLNAAAGGSADTFASGTSGVTHDVSPGGTYTLSETGGDSRYVQAGDWTCDNGVTVTNGQITAPLGKAVTCTVHNATAKLTLIKEVLNNSGGSATPASFQLTATPSGGPAGLGTVNVTGSTAGVDSWVRPGVTYTLSESGPTGYSQTSLQCKSGDDGTYAAASSVNLNAQEHVYCKFVNDDLPAGLTLVKNWDDAKSGSLITANDFTLTATPQNIPGQTTVSGLGGVQNAPVFAGSYVLSESGPSSSWFTPIAWSCTGGSLSGSTVTIANGASVTCYITNTANAPKLTLQKEVLGNDTSGGTAKDTDFTLTATRVEGVLPTLSGTEGQASITNAVVMVGTYTLDETGGPTGYSEGTWDCGAGHPVNAQNQVTIALGEDVTCVIDNTAIAPKLTLLKKVDNGTSGGTAVDTDWTLTGTGPVTISGRERDPSITAKAVKVGSYTLSESGPSGYAGSTWNCGAGRTSVTSVTLALGENVTCEVTNTASQAHLQLVKTVVNEYTTPTSAVNWMLSATGPGSAYIQGAGGTNSLAVPVGVYTLDEALNGSTGPAGYTEGEWSCIGGKQEGSSVTIGLGDNVICTIVNTAQEPTWEILKSSDPADGSTVEPGDVITYTVTAIKTGGVDPEDITLQDDLSDVLDNATFVAGSITAEVGSASLTGTMLTWDIPLLQGSKMLTYQVRVNEGAYDVHLRNHVTGSGSDNCPPTAEREDPDCTTDHPTPAWELTKASNPATGATVEPGEQVTYTLTATNTSHGVVDSAEVTDNLADVLDNATLTQPLPAGLTLSGTTLTWDVPTLQPGASASVSYTVTINAGQWDQHLRNVATPHNQGGDCATTNGCQTDHPTPDWELTKSSNPATGSTVALGSQVTYTLTATNTSDAVVDNAEVTDNLADVLDNATLTQPLAAGLTLGGTTLTWDVPTLQPGASSSVSYTVTVNAGQWDQRLRNVATPHNQGGDCATTTGCQTDHPTPPRPPAPPSPTPDWELTKTSNPATGSTVEPGEQVTYTLTATNTSDAVVDQAEVTDNLADILDNATLTQPLAAGLSLSGSTLTWDVPTLQPKGTTGASATVSYTVTVDAGEWDQHLRNAATPRNQGGDCATTNGCQTDHPTPAWELTKASDPGSGTEVEPGDTITYTLTARNTSDAVVEGGVAEDDLSEVLNNASLDETSLDASLTLSGTTLTWAIPTLQPGASASVSYTVTVDADAFNVIIENTVVPVGAGGTCVVDSDCTTTHDTPEVLGEEVIRPRPPTVKGGGLPATGAPEHAGLFGLLGTLVVGLGTVMILADRRRRHS